MRVMARGLVVVFLVMSGCSADGTMPLAPPSPRLAGAIDLGRLAPDAELDFVVGLVLRNPGGARGLSDAKWWSGGDRLSVGDFAARFAPSPREYGAVVGWLRDAGLLVTRVTDGRTTVSVHGRAAAVERAFAVELHQYRDAAGSFVAATTALRLAPELAVSINGVIGLEGAGSWHTHYQVALPAAGLMPLSAADLQSRYNAAVMSPGQGETIAILGAGLPPDKKQDVGAYYQAAFPGSAAPSYDQVFVGGNNRDGMSLAQQEQFENAIDAEMVLALAPQAHVVHVLAATNTPGLFGDAMAYIVDQLPQAHAVSVSFGNCERGQAGSVPVIDTLLAQAQAEGQQWFFSSGDGGTDDCADGTGNKHLSVEWPASSPFAVGVGGTMLSGASPGSEVAWNEDSAGNGALAGGGGPSEMLAKPAFQIGVTPDDGARDTPDVAALAGAPGVSVLAFGGMAYVAKGTSVAAPIWAAVWALVDQGKGGGGLSDGLTRLYAAGKSSGFNDITVGDNGGPDDVSKGFAAGPGYDLATGWGTPNVVNLVTSLK
jgi:kumamolisin